MAPGATLQGAGRLAFIEDYDMNVARHLVQGVDVWLNTPLRPLEASGTSGQKVCAAVLRPRRHRVTRPVDTVDEA